MPRLTRVYADGSKRTLSERAFHEEYDSSVKRWIDFNQLHRFGCGLFVDGCCVYKGYLRDDEVEKVETSELLLITEFSTVLSI